MLTLPDPALLLFHLLRVLLRPATALRRHDMARAGAGLATAPGATSVRCVVRVHAEAADRAAYV